MHEQLQRTRQAFVEAYGVEPTFAAAAPGRVNLIGEHIDYNDGFSLPLAIERQAIAVGRPRDDTAARLRSTALPGEASFDIDSAPISLGEPDWSRYLRGVCAFSYTPTGFDLMLDSDVPAGGGLSSSAAIEVATATLLEAMAGRAFEPVNKALLCQMAEHRFGGAKCGIMDQFISVMGEAGHALLIDCMSYETQFVPLNTDETVVLIINTNRPHQLGDEYNQRRAACAKVKATIGKSSWRQITMADLEWAKADIGEQAFRRGRHVVGEIARTLDCVNAMRQSDWSAVGRLMGESHASLRDDYEVSTPELDKLVELADAIGQDGGVIGSRMTGGGFGGCTVTLVKPDAAADVEARIVEQYKKATGIDPTAFVTRAAQGARVIEI
jgi:galactokinase